MLLQTTAMWFVLKLLKIGTSHGVKYIRMIPSVYPL